MKKRISKKKRRKPFRHLNQFDRDRIEAMLNNGTSQADIASVLKVNKGTISREVAGRKRRNNSYESDLAQIKADNKRRISKYQGMKIEKYPEIRKRVIHGLKRKESPDSIAGQMKINNVFPKISTNAIYKWLYSVYGQKYCKYLCTKRHRKRKQKKKVKREMIPNRVPIWERPVLGEHAEGDLFVSPRKSHTKRSGAIICVPSAKLLVGTMINNKKPATMSLAVNNMINGLKIDDLTLDNGIENKDHEDFNLPAYFADPHRPTHKPHIENSIGLVRRWFVPKKTNLEKVSEKKYQKYLHILNSKHRKSLGYRSAYEVALERGIIKKIPTWDQINKKLSCI